MTILVYGCGFCGDVARVEPKAATWRFLVRNRAALCSCSSSFEVEPTMRKLEEN